MSNIIYAPQSWNPISGCSPVSEGCANCWAKVMARRQRQEWGTVHLRSQRVLEQPLHWRNPKTVAVAFMGDWCHPDVPDEFIDKVFAVMALTPQHTYLLLTKRPERMRRYLTNPAVAAGVAREAMLQPWLPWQDSVVAETILWGGNIPGRYTPVGLSNWPLPNVWLGVSAENQARADERIPLLLETPAAHRWVSLEPLLEAVDLVWKGSPTSSGWLDSIDWAVIGGESGSHARPCNLGWIRDIRDQCKAAGVPCYVKQVGAKPVVDVRASRFRSRLHRVYAPVLVRDRKGENPDEWPADLRVREMPEARAWVE